MLNAEHEGRILQMLQAKTPFRRIRLAKKKPMFPRYHFEKSNRYFMTNPSLILDVLDTLCIRMGPKPLEFVMDLS